MIEKKYIKLRKNVVAEYRRLATPFFYINLKTITYTHYDYRSPFLNMGYFGVIRLPEGQTVRNRGWRDEKGSAILNKDIEKKLDIANEKTDDNIVMIKA